jgi:hypothetical protein
VTNSPRNRSRAAGASPSIETAARPYDGRAAVSALPTNRLPAAWPPGSSY